MTIGQSSDPVTVTLTGVGMAPITFGTIAMGGVNPDDWQISADGCSGIDRWHEDATCTFDVAFTPNRPRTAPGRDRDPIRFDDGCSSDERDRSGEGDRRSTTNRIDPEPRLCSGRSSGESHHHVQILKGEVRAPAPGSPPYGYTCVPVGPGGVTEVSGFPIHSGCGGRRLLHRIR